MIKAKEEKQTIEDIVRDINMNGFSIAEGVIPEDKVAEVREGVINAGAEEFARVAEEREKSRAQGHIIGAEGVDQAKGLINHTQVFVPYLTHDKFLGVAEAIFGPHISLIWTSVLINNPGTKRFYWHADWPYNQTNASHIPAPYPDAIMGLASIWMLTPFNKETGGTLVVPGSHRMNNNPSAEGIKGIDRHAPYKTEMQVSGNPGDVLIYDPRLWHAVAPNVSSEARVALVMRLAPWWFNVTPAMKGSPEHTKMVVDTGGKNYDIPPIKRNVLEKLPEDIKPLFSHWVED